MKIQHLLPIVLISLALFSCSTPTAKPINTLAEMHLHGRVHTITETAYSELPGNDSVLSRRFIYHFDTAGYLLLKDRYYNDRNDSDSSHSICLYTYDRQHRLSSDSTYFIDASGGIPYINRYSYDSLGRMTEWRAFNNRDVYKFKYRDDNRLSVKSERQAFTSYTIIYEYFYDTALHTDAEYKYLTEDDQTRMYQHTLIWQTHNRWDSAGHLLEQKSYAVDSNNAIRYTYQYAFDKMGNWITQKEYYHAGVVIYPSTVSRIIAYYRIL